MSTLPKWLTQMARSLTEIRSLARSHTRTALNVLVRIMRSKDVTAAARVAAANAILDRGWGRPTPADDKTTPDVLEDATDDELRELLQALRDDQADTAVGDDLDRAGQPSAPGQGVD